jgi:hypothetical protein
MQYLQVCHVLLWVSGVLGVFEERRHCLPREAFASLPNRHCSWCFVCGVWFANESASWLLLEEDLLRAQVRHVCEQLPFTT